MDEKYDIFGTKIRIDDQVSFNPPRYKGLEKGRVIGFTEKMVKIGYRTYTTNVFPQDIHVRAHDE